MLRVQIASRFQRIQTWREIACSPLYTYPTEQQVRLGLERQPNLGKGFIQSVGSSLGLDFKPEGCGDLQKSTVLMMFSITFMQSSTALSTAGATQTS